jgi:hypothetical protein
MVFVGYMGAPPTIGTAALEAEAELPISSFMAEQPDNASAAAPAIAKGDKLIIILPPVAALLLESSAGDTVVIALRMQRAGFRPLRASRWR